MSQQTVRTCIVIGENTLSMHCMQILLRAGVQVKGVVTPDESVLLWARKHEIRAIHPNADVRAFLGSEQVDYLFSIVNFWVIPSEVLALAKRWAINFHDGPLPSYAGYNATTWAILNGETEYAITWHEMAETIDGGRILLQRPVVISSDDTSFALNAKCYQAASASFDTLVKALLTDTVQPIEQDLSTRTWFGKNKRPANACLVDWSRPAGEIWNLARALGFGRYANPIGLPKIRLGSDVFVVADMRVEATTAGLPPGAIINVTSEAIRVATATSDISVTRLRTLTGEDVVLADSVARLDARLSRLELPSAEEGERLTAAYNAAAKAEDFWRERLYALQPTAFELPNSTKSLRYSDVRFPSVDPATVAAAFTAFLSRHTGNESFDVGYGSFELDEKLGSARTLFAESLPLHVTLEDNPTFERFTDSIRKELQTVNGKHPFARDIWQRYPELASPQSLPVTIRIGAHLEDGVPDDAVLALLIDLAGTYRLAGRGDIHTLEAQFTRFLGIAVASPTTLISHLPMLDEAELEQLGAWNSTAMAYDHAACIHTLIEAQVERTPDKVAVVYRNQSITYRELNTRANRLAHHLRGLGVRPEELVGILLPRSIELVVALLAVMKAGGAYVPLDPAFPASRIGFMLEDSKAKFVVAHENTALLNGQSVQVIDPGRVHTDQDLPLSNPFSGVTSDARAYLIYTSGSTGKPKGVEVLHRNVANFFAGMDDRLGTAPGVWLAVTSISFDISVLEMFWTLARGFEVVLQEEEFKLMAQTRKAAQAPSRNVSFSLAYFASDPGDGGPDQYRLLLEGAKFADRNGFEAVWTPERHFHAFGGIYPNPSVINAALAVTTRNVALRAGSVVLPLHHPLRVAEEWAVVDNLSNGRVGISFASGWQPNDFVLAPGNFSNAKQIMIDEIARVRNAWRGEAVTLTNGKGQDVAVKTLPRPVQKELPVWITAAGNPETFRIAGELGAGLLTHLLGQKVEELVDKVTIYREAWRKAGHPGDGHVTLMIHTMLGDSVEQVREMVRVPFSNYLKSSIDLIKNSPWAFPTFAHKPKDADGNSPKFTPEDIEAIVAFAFDRYFEVNGLFGTPESCFEMVGKLSAAGVDEIACLIDFGVAVDDVIRSFDLMRRLKDMVQQPLWSDDFSIGSQFERHRVTHFQCTPSMAQMLITDDGVRKALGGLKHMMVGGEALPETLGQALVEAVPNGLVHNMYGPTETTVWSSVYTLRPDDRAYPIGSPIANTQIHIVDRHLQLVPISTPGELLIGGDGVVRGYLNRPELTAERFVQDAHGVGGRLYRTGDLARWRPDGQVEYLGRLDHQVKIRGFRIELGEIEAALRAHAGIRTAVVVAREDQPGDKRLVAYVVTTSGNELPTDELRARLESELPEHMIPSVFVFVPAIPLTPNGKIDRNALPAPNPQRRAAAAYVAPDSDIERTIASVWQEALSLDRIGLHDNFFDLGAHSLLVFQVNHKLKTALSQDIPLVDMFRYPTVSSLAQYLASNGQQTAAAAQQGATRAQARQQMMAQRAGARNRG